MDFKFTQPCELRDFKEWHQGIPYYGFWALEISSNELLTLVSNAQTQLAPLLHSGYQRQPHIKLLACGLMAEPYFSMKTLAEQVQDLHKQNFNSFDIEVSTLNSFSTCPFLAVSQSNSIIEKIRQQLTSRQPEDDPSNFIPHITLGFYNNTYSKQTIELELSRIKEVEMKLTQSIDSIIFARYKTSDLQGPYEVIERIMLNKKEEE